MSTYDLVVRGGTVIDGARLPRTRTDIGVKDGVIVRLGAIAPGAGRRQIDATGFIVAPGFIDTHTHYDAQVFWDPTASNAGENGVTTVVTGNCGFGFAPCRPEDRDRYMLMMETTEQVPAVQMRAALPWSWESFPQLVEALRRTPKAINLTMYMPLNALMFYVMGEDAKHRRPTIHELGRMKALIHEAMNAGACGLSMSFMGSSNNHVDYDGTPMPTDVMAKEDAYELAGVLRERRDGTIQVISQIGPEGDRSISEGLARASGRPVLHNVFSVSSYTPELHRQSMRWLTEMNDGGLRIYAETVIHRGWVEAELFNSPGSSLDALDVYRELTVAPTKAAKRAMLEDPDFRRRLRENYNPVMFEATAGGIDGYTIISMGPSNDPNGRVGKTFGQIAGAEGKNVVDVFMDVALESDLGFEFKSRPIAENAEAVAELIGHSHVLAGASDGGAHSKIASGGGWATDLLIWLTRETSLKTLEEMHYRLSYQPARVMGIKDRGALLKGMAADILIYRLQDLYFERDRYEIRHDQPGGDWRRVQKAGGYRYIICNGEVSFEKGVPTGARPGDYLRVTEPHPAAMAAE
jgi:N-acyl-D-aspartate/D-glutamate deacylase